MVTPGTPPVPHAGGAILGPGCPTVLIGGLPAARVGDISICVGPPDQIVVGSLGVYIGGQMAARVGDATAHGGMVTMGLPSVLIGEVGDGNPSMGRERATGSLPKQVARMARRLRAPLTSRNCHGC